MISAVILTKNEEKNIKDCLYSLSWCDEIILIDDYSEDKTVDYAKRSKSGKVKIFLHHLSDDFSQQRNFGLEKAKGEWVLFLDADERISTSLQYEIVNKTSTSLENYSGYYLKRKDIIWGRKIRFGESGFVKLLRLARKNSGKWNGKVHETWKVAGRIGELQNPLLHYPHQCMSDFLEEINYYSDLRARELFSNGVRSGFISVICYPFGKFLYNYIFKFGFLDGVAGMIFAISMSFHSFLVRGKLWALQKKQQK